MNHESAAYGLWSLVLLNSAVFIILLQWPTLVTAVMFPLLVVVYARLARREEAEAVARFGRDYEDYRTQTPAFIPRLGRTNWEKST